MIARNRFDRPLVAHDALGRPFDPLVSQSGSDNPAVLLREPLFRLKLSGTSEYNLVTRPVGVAR